MLHVRSPLYTNQPLSHRLNKTVLCKMECWQPSGSFKNRGISSLCEYWVSQGKTTLVSSSGGNAGLATAYAGRHLNTKVIVCVPKTTKQSAIERIEYEGASVKVVGDVWDEADAHAKQLVEELNAGYVPPFDHPMIWAGHATLVDELVEQTSKPDAIILSVGGGGLLCGVAEGLKRHHWEDVPILAVESKGCESFHAALDAGHVVTLDAMTSICTSLGAKRVTEQALKVAGDLNVISVVTTDERCLAACNNFATDMRTIVEPACGAALSLLYDNHPSIAAFNYIVVIVCGGTNL